MRIRRSKLGEAVLCFRFVILVLALDNFSVREGLGDPPSLCHAAVYPADSTVLVPIHHAYNVCQKLFTAPLTLFPT